eukprot:NODE_2517_length_912_cov_112.472769_g2067_i0.p1 GENE.NODE_2517_length_912_cov_112.472769_g2067_i0~~NODE_2517_length_912_cov_112.472769_g2067_i0.p1  ORF type:complete len:280 (+),score=60.67 NODE_2517_length_912_cov_112.472769_g2067_i0:98-841(+)
MVDLVGFLLTLMVVEERFGGQSISMWHMPQPPEAFVKGLDHFLANGLDRPPPSLKPGGRRCFRHLLINPKLSTLSLPSPRIFNTCMSPVSRAIVDGFMVKLGLRVLPRRRKPIVGWMYRASNARVAGQEALVEHLRARCRGSGHCGGLRLLDFRYATLAVEQCRRVNEVDILVGPHGAGMTWLICLPYSSAVLLVGQAVDNMYGGMGNSLGHRVQTTGPAPARVWAAVVEALVAVGPGNMTNATWKS